ncbi:MAG: 50S ribosomal protein L24 [Alphaproteobacteria bacterium]
MAREKLKLKKGDKVVVVSGREKGRSGEILRVMRKERRVLVQGINMVKKHRRPTASSPGGINEFEAPLHISNVAIVDPKTNQPSRVGYKFLEDGKKVRYAKRSGEILDR